MIDILMDSRSPTQQRGEPKLSGGIIRTLIANAEGAQFKAEIEYYTSGRIVTNLDYSVKGNHDISEEVLKEIVQEIVEQTEGHSLIFQR